jgi:D-glycero-D-manno-heptose 1,7-bisphosphate phosphatase
MKSRAAFLDRDGVINRKPPGDGYVTRWEDLCFMQGVAESIALLNRAKFQVIVVSNQRCVARGLVTSQTLDSIHRQMCNWLATAGARIDAVYYCPHETQPPCSCRKPASGMLLTAAREHHLDLNSSWMIGDSEIDIEAGRNAGCKTVRLPGSTEPLQGSADVVASSLLEAVHQILQWEEAIAQEQVPAVATALADK